MVCDRKIVYYWVIGLKVRISNVVLNRIDFNMKTHIICFVEFFFFFYETICY